MTITIDLSNNLLNIILAVIGIGFTVGTTWYFTRRHYIKESRPPTAIDVAMQEHKFNFWIIAIYVVGLILLVALIISVMALPLP